MKIKRPRRQILHPLKSVTSSSITTRKKQVSGHDKEIINQNPNLPKSVRKFEGIMNNKYHTEMNQKPPNLQDKTKETTGRSKDINGKRFAAYSSSGTPQNVSPTLPNPYLHKGMHLPFPSSCRCREPSPNRYRASGKWSKVSATGRDILGEIVGVEPTPGRNDGELGSKAAETGRKKRSGDSNGGNQGYGVCMISFVPVFADRCLAEQQRERRGRAAASGGCQGFLQRLPAPPAIASDGCSRPRRAPRLPPTAVGAPPTAAGAPRCYYRLQRLRILPPTPPAAADIALQRLPPPASPATATAVAASGVHCHSRRQLLAAVVTLRASAV
ncbi:hypothetical protein ZIOFF_015818 [Zingiber officinale]|uniref:Uncharacterized protein n=1 Tax=Zingiber officinale TaxID=94328 RepID=A0A8J5I1V0_ZINOF|nr:hypothetical protein ZIOFF_015818 [Zingiber officinale]